MQQKIFIEELQEKLNKYFNSFLRVSIDNVEHHIMPTSKDIPKIYSAKHHKEKDMVEILFVDTPKGLKKEKISDYIYYLKNDAGNILGIEIVHLNQIFQTSLKKAIEETINEQIMAQKKSNNIREVISEDYKRRTLHFFKDIIKSDSIKHAVAI